MSFLNVTFETYQPAAGPADWTSGEGFLFVWLVFADLFAAL